MRTVVMPALGVAMSEGLLLQWLKSSGDAVVEGEPIMEIETDKSTVEVESPAAGILGPHLFEPGAIVPVGVEMTHIREAGDALPGEAAPPDARTPTEASPGPAPETPPTMILGATLETGAEGSGVEPGLRAPNLLSPRERRLARERELDQGEGPLAAGDDVAAVAAAAEHAELLEEEVDLA